MATPSKVRGYEHSTVGVRVRVSPSLKQVADLLVPDLSKKLRDFKDTYRQIAPALLAGLQENMKSGHGPGGEPWDISDAKYLRRKMQRGGGVAPLIFSGKTIAHLGTSDAVLSLTKRSLRLGFSGPQWKHTPALQYGTGTQSGKRRSQGARPFMGFSPRMAGIAEQAMLEHVQAVLAEAAAALNKGAASGG